ncbi:MAG: hypothetical protein ACOYKZ_03765 [Chlamydiia bacterium]
MTIIELPKSAQMESGSIAEASSTGGQLDLETPPPFKLASRGMAQGRVAIGLSAFGLSLSAGSFIRSNERVIHEVALDIQTWLFCSNIQLTYGCLFNVSPHLSIGPYLGGAYVASFEGRATVFPAGGFRLVAFRQAAEKNQASAFFGLRAGFPTILQLECGYAF